MRHMGLARSLLFRPLHGLLNLQSYENYIRTTRDLRLEVKNGERICIDSGYGLDGQEFIIKETETDHIAHDKLPLSRKYVGPSINNVTAIVGSTSTDKNCSDLRSILLAEMVARAMKAVMRLQLRNYSKNVKGVSIQFKGRLLVDFLNVLTGSNPRSRYILDEILYETITERFGPLAIRDSERTDLQLALEPCIVYAVRRLQTMMGVQLSIVCLSAFYESPVGFSFCVLDFLAIAPVVRFNTPMFSYAEALTALMSAQRAERDTYIHQVITDGATVLLRLCERKGSRAVENAGSLGKDFLAVYNRGCELEKVPGPERSDPFSRSAGFRPGVLCAVDTKFHAGVLSLHRDAHFTMELHARCTGGTDVLRQALTAGRFAVSVDRYNYWSFTFSSSQHDLALRLEPVVLDKWVYIAATFDGVTVRVYTDSKLSVALEVAGPLNQRKKEEAARRKQAQAELLEEETKELKALYRDIVMKCKSFFNSKDGILKMKGIAKGILQDPAFHDRDFGVTVKDDLTEGGILKVKKAAAMKEAKGMHTGDIYGNNSSF